MSQTSHFALPLIAAGQSQKEVTHNEALARIDALLHLAVDSRAVASPPAASVGQAWIVAPDASGAWTGHAGDVAMWDDAGWLFITPHDGCIAFVKSEQAFVTCIGGSWRENWPVHGLAVGGRPVLATAIQNIAQPSSGVTIDAEARAAIAAIIATLTTAGIIHAS